MILYEELNEILQAVAQDITAIRTFWKETTLVAQFNEVDAQVNNPEFYKHPNKETILTKQRKLKTLIEQFNIIDAGYTNYQDLLEMFKEDDAELKAMRPDIIKLTKQITKCKLMLLLTGEHDANNCYLSINSGAGGTESQDWAEMLTRMFLRFCEREGFKVEVLDHQAGEGAGIKSATLHVRGENAFGFLKAEMGIHRLVRISPFDANKRRHTSFAGVTVIPEIENVVIEINEEDLRIDTFRAGGAGGQHVNKTESAIRITHIPSGIVVQCQNERSQGQNKQTAMKMLKARLLQKQEEELKAKDNSIERKKIEWGSQIRSYVLHPYKMVKDHRTDLESHQPEDVLDGDIMHFIESYLLLEAKQ
ncbi:peptide chain release factor 2 [Candidatus Dependentiae bacterium]|nr:peptide chain release factor 2 [Candidatus Dependentiae bacterium]